MDDPRYPVDIVGRVLSFSPRSRSPPCRPSPSCCCGSALAAVALHLFLLATGAPVPFGLGLWGAFLVMGLINNVVPFSLLVWGQTQIASGLASILNATTPIFTIVVAHF